jgi:hypothetical protein
MRAVLVIDLLAYSKVWRDFKTNRFKVPVLTIPGYRTLEVMQALEPCSHRLPPS